MLTPENALLLLEGPAGQLRDRLRRHYMLGLDDEERMYWLMLTLETFLERHPDHGPQLQLLIAEIDREKKAGRQAATS